MGRRDCACRCTAVVRCRPRRVPPAVAALRRFCMKFSDDARTAAVAENLRARHALLLALSEIGKDYAKVNSRGGRLRLVWDLLRGHGAEHGFRALDGVS